MPFSLQAKLLRALQSGEIIPLGSEKEITIDTWVIATTNQELEKQISEKRFREDLYYRLNTISIYVPPLRERPEDIPVLIEYFVKQYASEYMIDDSLDAATIKTLSEYNWPGNVRELQNALKRILVVGDSDRVVTDMAHLPPLQEAFDAEADRISTSTFIQKFSDFEKYYLNTAQPVPFKKARKKALDIVEKEIISSVIEQTGGNKSKAAKILGISYKTLLYKMKELNL
jgi:transcriptional regulator with PAS, ATPase and Fis domain